MSNITIKNPINIFLKEEISGVPIEVNSLDSALLVAENEGKVYKYNDKLYRVVPDKDTISYVSLEGATVYIPSGWTAISKYGQFAVRGTVTYGNSTKVHTFDDDSSNLQIGYERYNTALQNRIYFDTTTSGIQCANSSESIKFVFTGGAGVTNKNLIDWCLNNNAEIEGGIYVSGYIFQEILSPEGTLEIAENGEVDVKSYEKVNVNIPAPVTNYYQGEVEYGMEEEVVIPTDLTDYIVTVPAGWKADAGYGQFGINTAFYGYCSTGAEHVKFSVGYEAFESGIFIEGHDCTYEAKDNYASFASEYGESCNNTSDNGFVFLVENGIDVTKPELISWLSSNGAIFDKQETMIIFGQGGVNQYVAKIGMTWEEFINSVYNIENITIDENNNIRYYSEYIVENEDGTLVKPTDVIDKTEYNLLGGSE